MNIGLVLEGGAMRGMFTAGVLDVFLDNDIHFKNIIGVSAGALFGVNFVSRQKGRVIRYNKKFNQDKDYLGIKPLLKEGNIISTKYAYEDVPHRLDPFDDEAFKKAEKDYTAVITNIKNGEAEYVKIESIFDQMDVLRASGSMPLVSTPVKIGEEEYLDGGISDSIPYKWMLEHGCDKVVVILTRDMNYRKKPYNSLMLKFCKPKAIREKMKLRHKVYNDAVEGLFELEKNGTAFVIRPSEEITIGKLERNPEKLQSVYELGLRDGKAILEKGLKEFLEQ